MLQTYRNRLKYFAAVPALAAGSAFAALPAGVDTAISDAGTDGKALAIAVLIALIGIFAIKLMKRGM
jgi:amino acid transporter